MSLKLYIAPVQGHTDAAWRHFHHEVYGGSHQYATPFIRCEHGTIRPQDLRDLTSPLNEALDLEPQVIFKDTAELETLLSILEENGATTANLNMGCPFPLQTGKGRGAGFISNRSECALIPDVLKKHPGLSVSVKMRLGETGPNEWEGIMDILNSMDLRYIALHPRVAKQQYGGELDEGNFRRFLSLSKNPVIFNGEIKTPADIAGAETKYPGIAGVMTARGLLGRPSLLAEHTQGKEWNRVERVGKLKAFHRALLEHYQETLCGDAQILAKIKPFWEYAEEEIGRKAWKAIRKASNMAKYNSAICLIGY